MSDETKYSHLRWKENQWKLRHQRWSEFLNGVKTTAKRLGSEARNESKRAGQRVSQSGIQKGKLAT